MQVKKLLIAVIVLVFLVAVTFWYWRIRPAPALPTTAETSTSQSLGEKIYEQTSNPIEGRVSTPTPIQANPIEGVYKNPFE